MLRTTWSATITPCVFVLVLAIGDEAARAQSRPTVAQALQLRPIQADVEYDTPTEEEVARCTLDAERVGGVSGWVVRDGAGRILRRFADTNGDNKVDLWCYYRQGVEVYRDIDSDFNGKADQYRWLGTAGIRWGLDKNEDGRIDQWKVISPEETTAEVIAALRDRDAARFSRVLLTAEELQSLGLGSERQKALNDIVAAAAGRFEQQIAGTAPLAPGTRWVHFGGTRPGVFPAGTEGAAKDVIAYENVVAMVDDNGKPGQVFIGTLVQVGGGWRVIDAPAVLDEGQTASAGSGFFFDPLALASAAQTPGGAVVSSEAMRELITRMEQIDNAIARATTPAQRAELNSRRADVMEQLIASSTTAEVRNAWIRQFADMVGTAVQIREFPGGVERLEKLLAQLGDAPEQAAYVRFRAMAAEYTVQLQDPDADYTKIHEAWLAKLEQFVKDYPDSDDAAEAMLQLAIAEEFGGTEEKAIAWYERILRDFGDLPVAKKAQGAKRRLESEGKVMTLAGRAVDGSAFDVASLRGRIVAVHYWATWCEPCKQEMATFRELLAKYGTRGFAVVGVNLDAEPQAVAAFLREARLTWPQLYESGGMESRFATEMGILTLPTTILLDDRGRVLRRNILAGQIEEELKKQLAR